MGTLDLHALDSAVQYLLSQQSFTAALTRLRVKLASSTATFVWETVDLASLPINLPDEIKSGWIFHLRRDVPSGAHYHPNSVQHMTLVRGGGLAIIGGESRLTTSFNSPRPLEDRWLVIERGVPHEFIPEGEDMTVVSFHTCGPQELEEIACDTGWMRHYEGPNA
ncbi:MAG: hypothetical protein GX536_03485 [Actinobacteria bacterium]|nr:hypothetical protein [Actinomycetota bacterium]